MVWLNKSSRLHVVNVSIIVSFFLWFNLLFSNDNIFNLSFTIVLNFTKFDNKVNYTTLYRYNTFKTTLPLSTILIEDPKASKLFQMYSTLLTQTTVVTAQTHPSHRFNFILNKELNISTFNLTKLKHK